MSGVTKTQKSITLGMNGAAVPRHGLILSQDGATHSRKVSRYLPAPRDALKTSKTASNVKIQKNENFKSIINNYLLLKLKKNQIWDAGRHF